MTSSEHEPGKLNTPPRETPDRGCPGTEDDTGLDTHGYPRHEAARSHVTTGMVHPSADLTTAGGPVGERSPALRNGAHQISGRTASPCAASFWPQRACIRPTLATKTEQAVRRCQRRAQATRTRQAGAARRGREGRHRLERAMTTANGFYIRSRAGCRPAASGRHRLERAMAPPPLSKG